MTRDEALRQFTDGIDRVNLGLALATAAMGFRGATIGMKELNAALDGIYWFRRLCRSVGKAVEGVSK